MNLLITFLLIFRGIRDMLHSSIRNSNFTINKDSDALYTEFSKADLGKIYLSIPFLEFSQTLKLKDKKKETRFYFSTKGKITLMILKNHYGFSDKKLIKLLNGNIFMLFL